MPQMSRDTVLNLGDPPRPKKKKDTVIPVQAMKAYRGSV
jgi:hypothetical protein